MTIVTLALCVIFFAAVFAAVEAASDLSLGFTGYAVALVSGSMVGALCVLGMHQLNRIVWPRASKRSRARQELYAAALLVLSVGWAFVAFGLGRWVTLRLMRLV